MAEDAAKRRSPTDRGETIRLIRFFTLEKALYEVLYELANRPAWVPIPLASALSLIAQFDSAEPLAEPHHAVSARVHRMPQGAELEPGGGVRFRLWAPGCESVDLALYDRDVAKAPATILSMAAQGEGWHEMMSADAAAGG